MSSYDTVHLRCPDCGKYTEYQSKLGDCDMSQYDLTEAPLLLVADLHDESINGRLFCDNCSSELVLRVTFSVEVTTENDYTSTFRTV